MLLKRCRCEDPAKCPHPWSYLFVVHGRRYRRSTKTRDRRLAERIEQRRRIAVLDGKDVETERGMLLAQHVKDYLAYTEKHNTTHYKDAAVLSKLEAIAGKIALQEVAPFTIERWRQARLQDGVSKSTVNRELNIIRGCFTKAVEWRRLTASPCVGVRAHKVDDQRVRVLSDDELKAVLSGDPWVALVCRTTLECLPRLMEVISIRRDHIGPNWIEFRRKGGRVTRAFVTDALRKDLLARAHPSGYIFGEGLKGEPPIEQAASQRVVRELRRLEIVDASHHTMRHTGVTLMLERGVNPRVIQSLAGWTSLRMLERYGHARDAEMQKAVAGNASYLAAL